MRLDADPEVHARLSATGVTPTVVGSGTAGRRTFVVQRRVDGGGVDGGRMAALWRQTAELLRRVHADPALGALASPLSPAELVETSIARLRADHPAQAGGRELLSRVERPPSAPSVPTHGDPNASNFLFDGSLWLVDWDDLRLADPMRDIGQVAWWYLDRSAWAEFTAAAGAPFGPGALDRLFWWVAAESLDVAVRLEPSDPDAAAGFFADMAAALAHEPNPRRRPAG